MNTGSELKDEVLKIVASGLPEERQLELIEQVLLHPEQKVDEEALKERSAKEQIIRDS